MKTTWHCAPIAAATSSPDRPGMRMSRNAICGRCAAKSASASSPSRASATTVSSGQTAASFSFTRSRISASSSAISAVGGFIGQALSTGGAGSFVGGTRAAGSVMRARKPRGSFSSRSSTARSP